MRRSAGFTLVELVVVIIVLGIIAAVALPRMTTGEFHAAAFHDKAVSALRFAQKTATSHRRLVCATFTATTLTLNIAQGNPATDCDAALILPGGAATVQSTNAGDAAFSPVPAALFFQPDGRATSDGAGATVLNGSMAITGQTPIVVVGATGHVH